MKKSYKLIIMCLLLMPILAMIGGCGSQSKQIGSSGSKESDTSGYSVLVTDEDNKPVPGVSIQFCTEEMCFQGTTDDTGIASFDQEPGTYSIHVLGVPEGFAPDKTEYKTPSEPGLVTIVLKKN